MELMISTFYLIFAAAISIIIAQAIEKVSVNYISMLIGVIFALIPFLNNQIAPFNSEIFMELNDFDCWPHNYGTNLFFDFFFYATNWGDNYSA